MWVDAQRVSHTIAIADGRNQVDAALLNWIERLEVSDIQVLEDGLEDIQDNIFDEVDRVPFVPFGREGQELPSDFLVGLGLGDLSVSSLLDYIEKVDLIWRLDVVELVMDVVGEVSDVR